MTEEFEIKLQKFADSELSPDEEANVLLDCELAPARWKDLALALIAERRLTAALAGFDDDDVSKNILPAGEIVAATRWASTVRNLAISFAVLMAFVIGRQQGAVILDQPKQAVAATGDPAGDETNGGRSAVNIVEANPLAGRPTDAEIDSTSPVLVDTQADSSDWHGHTVSPWTVVSKPVITEEDRGVFSDAGLDVEEQNTVYIVSDAEGGRWAIPWKAVNIRYSADQ